MRMPFRERAIVPKAKLIDYLLSPTHPTGKAKAQFFTALGFMSTNVADLEQQLIAIAQVEDVWKTIDSPHGTKYVIQGILQAVNGRQVLITTVWVVETGMNYPRCVTAYPA